MATDDGEHRHADEDEAAVLARLGRAVRERRAELGISQEALAERSGHHRNFVGRVERGEQNVSVLGLVRIAAALGCPVGDLVADAVGE